MKPAARCVVMGILSLYMLSQARTVQNINQNWKFNQGDVSNGQSASVSDASWPTVCMPHTFQCENAHLNADQWRGVCWYRKTLTIDNSVVGKKVFLKFEAALTSAQVYVNGTSVTTHYGGFLPFTVDITSRVLPGQSNLIAVRVDNNIQRDVPPERVDGGTIDMVLFGGIYRDVYLMVTDNVYIPDAVSDATAQGGGLFITTPGATTASATVKIKTVVKNENAAAKTCVLNTTLFTGNGVAAGTTTSTQAIPAGAAFTYTQNITVNSPALWSPVSPSLYRAVSKVSEGATVLDTLSSQFGIRTIRFDRVTGFWLNGQNVKLLGVNRHQAYPYIGNALPDRAQYREAKILKDMGCNYIRLSHYPQSPAFMDALDELGIMCWVEPPTWQGQYFNSNSSVWLQRHLQDVRSMIRRDRNHPSVLVWGVAGNEADFNVSYEDSCQMIAKSEDSAHYTTTARNKWVLTDPFDVTGLNYFEPPLPGSNQYTWNTGFINSEYTGHTYQTTRFNPEAHLKEQAHRHELMVSSARERPWVAGGTGWCAFDYNSRTGSAMGSSTVDGDVIPYHSISYHGVADIFRIPKFAYYFYKSQAAADNYDGSKHPMVFIESYASYPMPSTQTIKVLSNCDQVDLYVNGTFVRTQSPDAGTSLAHPPFTFSNVSYASPGNVRADGKIGGVVRATQTVNRPGTASKIALWADTDTLANDGSDIARIVVSITDNNGTVVPTATNTVTVSATSLGKVICGSAGPQTSGTITMEAGKLAFLVQAGVTAGTITASASGTGLAGSQISINVSDLTAVRQPGRSPVISGRDEMVPSISFKRNVIAFDNLDPGARWQLMLIAPNGKVIRSASVAGSVMAKMQTESVPSGLYAILIKGNSVVVLKKVILLLR